VTQTVRAPFRSLLTLNPRAGILLLVVFGVVRVALVLHSNVTGSYQVVSLVFVAMIALPWVLLTRDGRKLHPRRRRESPGQALFEHAAQGRRCARHPTWQAIRPVPGGDLRDQLVDDPARLRYAVVALDASPSTANTPPARPAAIR
jgi:hypothetical protein